MLAGMKQPLLLAAGVFAASLTLLAGSAQAGILVLGSSDAAVCSNAAISARGGSDGMRACDQALKVDALSPRDRAATYVNRGILRMRGRGIDRAVEDFNSALRLNPNLGEALVNRGAARIGQRRYREALKDLEQGTAMGSAEPEKAWYNRGLAEEGLGDVRAAYRSYMRAAELRPDWEPPKRELARFTVRPRT
jgi:tetratricopeptide (TPR) repeat protein